MLTCPVCPQRTFGTAEALHRHQSDSRNHYYCRPCTTAFGDHNSLFDHATEVHSTTCGSCRRMFTSKKGVQRHFLDSPKHPKCWSCRIGFRDCANLNTHKVEVHSSSPTQGRKSRKNRRQKSSPTASSSDNHNSSTSTLLLFSPASSVTSQISDRHSMIQRRASSLRDRADDVSTIMDTSIQPSDVARPPDLPQTNVQPAKDRGGAAPSASGQDPLENRARNEQLQHLSSLIRGEECNSQLPAPLAEPWVKPSDLSQTAEHPKSDSASLLETNLPAEWHSDPSGDHRGASGRLSLLSSLGSHPAYHRTSPQSRQRTPQGENDDIISLRGRTGSQCQTNSPIGIVDAMRAACHARSVAAARPPSPLRLNSPSRVRTLGVYPWLSKLPTILDGSDAEAEADQCQDIDSYSEAPEEPSTEATSENGDLSLPAGRRKRRLSLSPTLPSIPEAVHVHEVECVFQFDRDDSDSDSSQGIYEHRGEDFLYDSLSDNERCQTPMTYLTADELDFEFGAKRNSDYSTSPILLVEDLTRLAEELCSSSTTDDISFDPSADPLELHPSANNSPMSATFPKRPRAWSLSDTQYDSRYLSPEGSRLNSEVIWMNGDSKKLREDVNEREHKANAEPDEAAIAADEAAPRIIEEDLFSEPDEAMEPLPNAINLAIDVGEAQFAEEGHPLRSLISLDTLPLSAKGPNSSELVEPLLASEPQGESDNHVEHEGADERRSPLRCRLCQSDPCKNVTATFCGHIFCNECITREVMAQSKCPVCYVPTLLYCLFKLDLGS